MIVIGAKGMAREVLEILSNEQGLEDSEIVFFDNVSEDIPNKIFDRFKVLRSFDQVKNYFNTHSNKFTLGLGTPLLRKNLALKFTELGGQLTSIQSLKAHVGTFNTTISKGSLIMQGVVITNDVYIGEGVLVNVLSSINHDTWIGDYVEIACGVTIPGRCKIGNGVFIGSNSVLNPDISIGDNAIIGSGAVVISNVPANATVVGNPGKIIKIDE